MIGLDTNVLVRYVTQDDPVQSPKASRLIESLTTASPGFVSLVSVVELVWVLQSSYQSAKSEVVAVLETLLRTRELTVEHPDVIWQALRRFTSTRADFADCLIERCDPYRPLPSEPLPGEPPSPLRLPSGCAFHPRCRHARAVCAEVLPPTHVVQTHRYSCVLEEPLL